MLAIVEPRHALLAKMKLFVSISSKDLMIPKFTALLYNDHNYAYYAIAGRVSPTVRLLLVIHKQEKSWLRQTL